MKIALVGYGNMGKIIEEIVAEQKTNTIVSISYQDGNKLLDISGIKKADVVIDFTSPEIVMDNITQITALKKPLVVGTTGWYDQLDKVERMVAKNKTGLVYGQNFSIGANIFFNIIGYATKLFNTFKAYDIYGLEIHHAGKKDSPSGTAKKLAQIVLENSSVKKHLVTDKLDRQIQKDELHFSSVRAGSNPGRHEIVFDSFADEITLLHQAHNRRGFAEGALLAAEFIRSKKGIYSFDDILKGVIGL